MSHATMVSDGLWALTLVSTALLAIFVSAVARMPAELARPAVDPATAVAQRAAPAYQAGPPVPLPARAADDDSSYVARHASPRLTTRGGPPWGPAPKPPGMELLPMPRWGAVAA